MVSIEGPEWHVSGGWHHVGMAQ